MGILVEGVWRDVPRDTKATGGAFVRPARRWLCGARFDAVYYPHFKCNLRRLTDYPRLWRYTRRIYYRSMNQINPAQIVPEGPLLDFRLH